MKATLLGFTVPDDLIEEINRTDAFMATQTHRFAWGVVLGLTDAGVQVDLLSVAPVSDYPGNPKRAYSGGRFREHGVEGRLLPFVNLLGLKHVTRWLAAWWVGGKQLRRAKPHWLLVHGVHSPFLWYAVYARQRFGVRAAVFLTDPPGVLLPEDSGVRRCLKKIDIAVTKRALTRVDAVIVLAEPLATDFAPGVPSLTMEGLFDADVWPLSERAPDAHVETCVVTYAGGLSEEYGVGLLVRAILASENPNLRLQLFGRGPLEGWINEVACIDPRVMPPRLLKPQELGAVYASSTVLVQPRPVGQGFVRYSFPSKLLEYMGSGTPVISTRLPSIPPEYEDMVVWAEDSTAGLAQAIGEVAGMPVERLAALGRRASGFVRLSRSAASQGARMRDFLRTLSEVG